MLLADAGGTVLSVVLVGVLVGGYVVLWAIWHFFFRGKGSEDDGTTRKQQDPP